MKLLAGLRPNSLLPWPVCKDPESLLAFNDFPAQHWKHIRTTNPIESVFATVRLRTHKCKSCGSRKTTLAMTHQLILSAQTRWQRLRGHQQLADVVNGVIFKDGDPVISEQPERRTEPLIHQI